MIGFNAQMYAFAVNYTVVIIPYNRNINAKMQKCNKIAFYNLANDKYKRILTVERWVYKNAYSVFCEKFHVI